MSQNTHFYDIREYNIQIRDNKKIMKGNNIYFANKI